MPSYRFTGLTQVAYPFDRDARNIPLGTVDPGDIRELDEPLDHMWVEASDEDQARLAAEEAERLAAETANAGGGTPESKPDAPEGEPDPSAA